MQNVPISPLSLTLFRLPQKLRLCLVTAIFITTILYGHIFGSVHYGSSVTTFEPVFGQPDGGTTEGEGEQNSGEGQSLTGDPELDEAIKNDKPVVDDGGPDDNSGNSVTGSKKVDKELGLDDKENRQNIGDETTATPGSDVNENPSADGSGYCIEDLSLTTCSDKPEQKKKQQKLVPCDDEGEILSSIFCTEDGRGVACLEGTDASYFSESNLMGIECYSKDTSQGASTDHKTGENDDPCSDNQYLRDCDYADDSQCLALELTCYTEEDYINDQKRLDELLRESDVSKFNKRDPVMKPETRSPQEVKRSQDMAKYYGTPELTRMNRDLDAIAAGGLFGGLPALTCYSCDPYTKSMMIGASAGANAMFEGAFGFSPSIYQHPTGTSGDFRESPSHFGSPPWSPLPDKPTSQPWYSGPKLSPR